MEMIETNKLKPDPNQPRQQIDNEAVERLAATYEREGIISPIEITPDFKILVGELRWRAAKKVGLKEVPVIINDKEDYKKADRRLERQLIENETRKELNIIDRARAYKKYVNSGHSERELARLLGHKDHETIRNIINLLAARTAIIKHLEQDDSNWTYHREVEDEPKISRQQKDEIHQQVIDGAYKTRDELQDTLSFIRNNPKASEKIVKAKDQLERDLTKLQFDKPVQSKWQPKSKLKIDPKKQRFSAMIDSLNVINQSRLLWVMTDWKEIINEFATEKIKQDIIKSIKTIIKAWNKTLEELG